MQEVMRYLNTYNIAAQALAVDGTNAENIQTTGTGGMILNGQYFACAEDAELDISACTEGTLTAWATATSYSVGDVRSAPSFASKRVKCTVAHTSSADTEPFVGGTWGDYWEESPHDAVNASGTVVTTLYERWFIVLAKSTGVISIWEAGDEALIGNSVLKIPQFDPEMYCCLGLILVAKDDANDLTIGTTALTGDATYVDLVGPVFPHPDNLDKN